MQSFREMQSEFLRRLQSEFPEHYRERFRDTVVRDR
jgi:hypothetical protein